MAADYITLLGAEQVQSAAGAMRNAADEMQRAANTMDCALASQRTFLEEWLNRFEQVLAKAQER